MKDHFIYRASLVLFVGAIGCGDEALEANDESLAQQAVATSELTAALAYYKDGAAVLQDVSVSGALLDGFRLSALPPPPADLLSAADILSGPEDDPPYLVATIAAVPRDHASALYPPMWGWSWSCDEDLTAQRPCTEELQMRRVDGPGRATVRMRCNVHGKDCTIAAIDGDATLVRDSLRLLAGRVNDHRLLYVGAYAPAGSLVSQAYAGGSPLTAGHHLLVRRSASDEESARRKTCEAAAEKALIAEYAKDLGRSFDNAADIFDFLLLGRANAKLGTAHSRIDQLDHTNADVLAIFREVAHDFETRMLTQTLAYKCWLIAPSYVAVGAPGAHELSVALAPSAPKVGDVFPDGSPWAGSRGPFDHW